MPSGDIISVVRNIAWTILRTKTINDAFTMTHEKSIQLDTRHIFMISYNARGSR
jgi:hypothetical protein